MLQQSERVGDKILRWETLKVSQVAVYHAIQWNTLPSIQ